MKIVFMGTPDFAVTSLKALVESGSCEVVAVITAPDKPSGRGLVMNETPVKKYAVSKGVPVLQPEKLKNLQFLEELRSYQADLQIVVAFRMLPEVVWNMPRLGTFNLHGDRKSVV
jgi:methionyl-tRNA formyltransferase